MLKTLSESRELQSQAPVWLWPTRPTQGEIMADSSALLLAHRQQLPTLFSNSIGIIDEPASCDVVD